MMRYFYVSLIVLFVGSAFANTANLAQQMLAQNIANGNANGSGCNVGTNLSARAQPTTNPYGTMQRQDTQCQPGETMTQCMKRLYNIK